MLKHNLTIMVNLRLIIRLNIYCIFRTLTDESDKYSLSKAVSAPLRYIKNFQTEQVVDKTRNYVTKRNSWDEVSYYD